MSRASHPPCVLLTGFDPFGGESSNPSWDAVSQLHGKRIATHRLHALRLPVCFGDSRRVLEVAIATLEPAAVICVGQAGGRSAFSIERVAINVDDARIADNAGMQPIDRPIVARGPAAYFSRLPIKAIARSVREAGIPAEISQTAGTFVCNHVFYALMHALRRRKSIRGGFIHIPYAPQQAAQLPGNPPSMAIEQVVAALRIAVCCTLQTTAEIVETGGALD